MARRAFGALAALTLWHAGPCHAQLLTDPWEVSLAEAERTRQTAFWRGGASFMVPGCGQFLNQDGTKGWLHLGTGVSLVAVPLLLSRVRTTGTWGLNEDGNPLAGSAMLTLVLVNAGFHLYSALDAYQVKSGVRPQGGWF